MRILGIETSCDETGAAVIEGKGSDKKATILSNVVASSLTLHAKTGGIIPEIAAREQVKYIIPVIKKTLALNTNISPRRWPASPRGEPKDSFEVDDNESIDAIAVTVGPGLIGSLLVGVETAKTLSYAWKKPIVPVNHLIGHIYANLIDEKSPSSVSLRAKRSEARQSQMVGIASSQAKPDPRNDNINFPALALIVSGGHTDLVLLKSHGSIKWLGGTRDDAAGEAFDKIGRLLGLPYPGGPAIEKAAKNGDPKTFNFPRPMIDSEDLDFSFSGLKTSVLYLIKRDSKVSVILGRSISDDSRISQRTDVGDSGRAPSSLARMTNEKEQLLSDLSASIQQAVIDVLVTKTLKAAQKYKVKSILLGGGVAANQSLREKLNVKCQMLNFKFFAPPKNLCTDNGAMIASAAFFNYKPVPWQEVTADPELYFD